MKLPPKFDCHFQMCLALLQTKRRCSAFVACPTLRISRSSFTSTVLSSVWYKFNYVQLFVALSSGFSLAHVVAETKRENKMTRYESTADGKKFTDLLTGHGIKIGIKVDAVRSIRCRLPAASDELAHNPGFTTQGVAARGSDHPMSHPSLKIHQSHSRLAYVGSNSTI